MCSIILRITETAVYIAANRDEMIMRPWATPAEFWPGIIGGRDEVGGGTWLAMNQFGVVAAVLNRHGSLGPAPDKRSRGELPLLALESRSAALAAEALAGLNCAAYRSFNLVVADGVEAFCLSWPGDGVPFLSWLPAGVTMLTAGEPNDVSLPRIARHLPRFEAAAFEDWGGLLADGSGAWDEALNIPPHRGFGTVCSSLMVLPRGGQAAWAFCGGRPSEALFLPVPGFLPNAR
jgi:hypothetical protein